MLNFVENGFVENGFVENSGSSNQLSNIDYNIIFHYIDKSNNNLKKDLIKILSSFDIETSLNSKFSDFENSLNLKIENIESSLSSKIEKSKQTNVTISDNLFNLSPSLNGAYGTFKDNSYVTSSLYPVKLKVLSSSFILNEENNYIVLYKVENSSGDIILMPNVFISLYNEKEEEKESD